MPQLEDGFTRIASELLDAIVRFNFSKRHYKVVLAVIRKTYGYGKKTDDMTITQLANMTGLDLGNCSKAVFEMSQMRALSIQQGVHGYVIGLNKNYQEWKPCQNDKPLSKQQSGVVKITNTIDNPKRNNNPPSPPAKRGSKRAPDDFVVTPDLLEWAAKNVPSVNVEFETGNFRDHEYKQARTDWPAAWRKWMRNALKFSGAPAEQPRKKQKMLGEE
jgi:phage replication O-like protein O